MRFRKNTTALFLLTVAVQSSTTLAQTNNENCPVLSWADEFEGSSLDSANWTPQWGDGCQLGQDLCGWGNNEPQWYRTENVQVSSGMLQITAKKESFQGKQFTSGRIRSLNQVEFDLSKDTLVEARIKVPSGGLGIWPAFWMMPSPEVTWPLGGEIDIMEFIGREPFYAQGYMHYGVAFGDKFEKGGPIRLPEPLYEEFHVFSVVKTANRIAWLLDGHEYQSYTPDDIEPKYSWPFEQNYYIILNVAAGGNWPGYPDESTIFPTTMEVDYVRVYDLEGGKTVPLIEGTRLVHQNQAQVQYCVRNAGGAAITWEVPGDSSFVGFSSQDCISVDFGASSGYIKASVATSCTSEATYELAIPVQVQPFYGVDFSILDPTTTPVMETGITSSATDEGAPALKYKRSLELYDTMIIDTDLLTTSDLPAYLSGDRKFFLEVKTTTSAPCTQVLIQLEDKSLAGPDNSPVGRHSRYQCFLEPTRDWQRVACDFIDRPDPSVTVVDRVVILLDPTLTREDVYFFRSIDVAVSGCTSNCEALQTNGASTTNCRKAAKSEEGACSDGINNNYEGYNGNLVTDCADPLCFNIDPVCGGSPTTPPPASSPPPSNTPTPTRHLSASPSISPVVTTVPATVSTPTVKPTTSTGTASPSSATNPAPVANPLEFDGPTECSLNPACVGLVDDCCPTSAGIYLFCCFEEPPSSVGYEKEFTFVGPQAEGEEALYFASTSLYTVQGTGPDSSVSVVSYKRNPVEVFDLIYYKTEAITNAADYVSGNKKFFIDVYSQASNQCTQILLQLDSLPMASDNPYPIGRHSRYVAFTTTTNAWERLEFTFVDQPDATVSDSIVNATVLFFEPGTLTDGSYFFRNLDSAVFGCDLTSNNCEETGPKSCPAYYEGEDGSCSDGIDNDYDGLVDCQDLECVSDSVCALTVSRSYASAKSMLRVEDEGAAGSSSSRSRASASSCAAFIIALFALAATI